MLRDEPELTMDMKVLGNMSLADINLETLHGYRNRHMAYRAGHPWENLDDEQYLERSAPLLYMRKMVNFIRRRPDS